MSGGTPFQHFGGWPAKSSLHFPFCGRLNNHMIDRAVLSPQSFKRAAATVQSPAGMTATETQLASIVCLPSAGDATEATTSCATSPAPSSVAAAASGGAGGGGGVCTTGGGTAADPEPAAGAESFFPHAVAQDTRAKITTLRITRSYHVTSAPPHRAPDSPSTWSRRAPSSPSPCGRCSPWPPASERRCDSRRSGDRRPGRDRAP